MSCGFLLGIAVSAHIGLNEDFNNVHPQARVQCDNYISGIYLNSYENISVYAGWESKITDNLKIEFGVADGYSHELNRDIIPFGRVVYRNFFLAPLNTDGGVVLGVEFNTGG